MFFCCNSNFKKKLLLFLQNESQKGFFKFELQKKRFLNWAMLFDKSPSLLLLQLTWLPYARQYNPRFVYFLPTFWSSFMYCDLWPYVWLVFKSGFESRAGYSGARTVVKENRKKSLIHKYMNYNFQPAFLPLESKIRPNPYFFPHFSESLLYTLWPNFNEPMTITYPYLEWAIRTSWRQCRSLSPNYRTLPVGWCPSLIGLALIAQNHLILKLNA